MFKISIRLLPHRGGKKRGRGAIKFKNVFMKRKEIKKENEDGDDVECGVMITNFELLVRFDRVDGFLSLSDSHSDVK